MVALVEAFEVEIEVHAGWGNSDKIAVVGLPDAAVKESKDRVTSPFAIVRCQVERGKEDHDQTCTG
jgi:predicted ATPase with chaperone activity